MSVNLTRFKDTFANMDFFKGVFHIANSYTNNWFSPIFVTGILVVALWVMRENEVETTRAISISCLLSFIVALIIMSLGEIEGFFVTILGILTVIMILFQKYGGN